MTLPIYSREHLKRFAADYLRRPAARTQGAAVIPIARPKPCQIQQLSYFVARIAEREPVITDAPSRRSRSGFRVRRHFVTAATSYVLAAISWADHSVTELERYHNKADALRALAAK